MRLTRLDIARMIDLSVVQAEGNEEDIHELAALARREHCIAVFALPSQTPLLKQLLSGAPYVHLGGVVGFPSGGATTRVKTVEAGELVSMGCNEIDMVINIGMLRSGRDDAVREDILAVIEAASGVPVKVIAECHHLSREQLLRACDIAIEAGASHLKTGTGWAPTGATLENISFIKTHVGERIGIKAAGGVRDLETLLAMYRRGATRFGVGLRSAHSIFERLERFPGGIIEPSEAPAS